MYIDAGPCGTKPSADIYLKCLDMYNRLQLKYYCQPPPPPPISPVFPCHRRIHATSANSGMTSTLPTAWVLLPPTLATALYPSPHSPLTTLPLSQGTILVTGGPHQCPLTMALGTAHHHPTTTSWTIPTAPHSPHINYHHKSLLNSPMPPRRISLAETSASV